jgi:hypothetical protein
MEVIGKVLTYNPALKLSLLLQVFTLPLLHTAESNGMNLGENFITRLNSGNDQKITKIGKKTLNQLT